MTPSSHALWIGGLRADVDDNALWQCLRRFGDVLSIKLNQPTAADGWAVATFGDAAAAARAEASLHLSTLPTLTHYQLKAREWVDKTSWRSGMPGSHQQDARADTEEEEEGPPAWQLAGGWAQHHAANTLSAHEDDDEEGEEYDPLVELWVGNLSPHATRVSLRRAFECFGEVASVQLQAGLGVPDVQFAFVRLPASAAEAALEELNGLTIFELTGPAMSLIIKQSTRSLKPLQHWQARQPQRAEGGAAQPQRWRGQGEGSAQVLLHGDVRRVKAMLVCDGPPSATLWLGNVTSSASPASLRTHFGSYGTVLHAKLFRAPGYQNPYQYGFVTLASAADASSAHDTLQGATALPQLCDGRPLKLRYAWSKWAPASPPQEADTPPGFPERAPRSRSPGSESSWQPQDVLAPAAVLPEGPVCAACGADPSTAALKRCTGCRAVHYCGRDCQLRHWEACHLHDCPRLAHLQRLVSKQPPEPLLAPEPLRLLTSALRQPGGRQAQLVRAVLEPQGEAAAGSAAA